MIALLRISGQWPTNPLFAQGAQVDHPKFGLGSVMSCNEDYIVIKFDDHGEKKFVLQIVLPNLKKSDRQPPVEKRQQFQEKSARRREVTPSKYPHKENRTSGVQSAGPA